jgi:hypothetical protein
MGFISCALKKCELVRRYTALLAGHSSVQLLLILSVEEYNHISMEHCLIKRINYFNINTQFYISSLRNSS